MDRDVEERILRVWDSRVSMLFEEHSLYAWNSMSMAKCWVSMLHVMVSLMQES